LIRLLLLLALVFAAAPTLAQAPATSQASAPPSSEQARALIQTLENDAERAKLVAQLKQLLAAQEATQKSQSAGHGAAARIISFLSDRIERVSTHLVEGAEVVIDAPRLNEWLRSQLADPQTRANWIAIGWRVLLVLGAGLASDAVARWALVGARRAIEARNAGALWLRLAYLVAWAVLDLVPVAAFAAAGYIVLPLIEPTRTARLIALALVNAIVLARVLAAAARLIFMPRVQGLRVLPLRDEDSIYGYVWLRRLAFVAVYGWVLAETALLLGLPASGHEALVKIVGFVVAALLVILILQMRQPAAAWLRGPMRDATEPTRGWRTLRARLADIWHVLAIVYVIGLYTVWALDIRDGFNYVGRATLLTVVIFVGARLAAEALRSGLRGLFSISDDLRQRYPGLEYRANRYLAVLQSSVVALVYVVGIFAALAAWGLDSVSWLVSGFGQRALGRGVLIAAVVIGTVIAWELVNATIERRLARGGPGLGARARTLLPLARSVAAIVLSTIAVFTILSEIGLDIGPLLAGAGVVGLAIGFGSQTLVKDIVTGVFILMENQIAVGDVVKTGEQAGQVEAITIRTLRLRDFDGTLRIIPFSAVTTVENMTKDYSRFVIDIPVSYREDIEKVIGVLKEIGAELQADPQFGHRILGPIETFGIEKFEDSAVILRARITTRPIAQWDVGREFNMRLKRKFDALGIEMPFPHRTIYFGVDREGKAPPVHVQMEGAINAEKASN